ncbi:unnamed protein product, partial [Discosporangium mesarthrocarpum]
MNKTAPGQDACQSAETQRILANLAAESRPPSWLVAYLRSSARSGNAPLARALIEAGARPDARDKDGYTPLHWAAMRGHAGVARSLLRGGAQSDARSPADKTPLHHAAASGSTEVVLVLLEAGADANARNRYGSTPLHRAAFNGRHGVVRALLESGKALVDPRSNAGRSPLHLACRNARPACVEALLLGGADEGAVAADGSTPMSSVGEDSEDGKAEAKVRDALRRMGGRQAWRRRGWLVMLRDRA